MVEIENTTSKNISTGCTPRKYGIYWLPIQGILLLSLALWILSLIFSAKGLPDYDSYEGLYESVTGYYLWGWEPFFVYLNYLGRYFRLSYEAFRSVVLFLSLTSFTAAMYIFSRKLNLPVSQLRKQNSFFAVSIGLIFTFAFTVFFLEYFLIRIRAGFSISVVFLAFSLLWSRAIQVLMYA